jgi:hypothetical protein
MTSTCPRFAITQSGEKVTMDSRGTRMYGNWHVGDDLKLRLAAGQPVFELAVITSSI